MQLMRDPAHHLKMRRDQILGPQALFEVAAPYHHDAPAM
jgi:hypothetical protein